MTTERTVHVVDDDADVLRSLERLLLAAGFTPVLYKSAFAVMDAASGLSAGCLLLDVRMAGMDGPELQARLNDRGIVLPVIVMTGQGDVPTAVRAMKAGAVEFIEKPFDDERLLAAIESALAGIGRTERDREAAQAAQRVAGLSRRKRQVLDGRIAGQGHGLAMGLLPAWARGGRHDGLGHLDGGGARPGSAARRRRRALRTSSRRRLISSATMSGWSSGVKCFAPAIRRSGALRSRAKRSPCSIRRQASSSPQTTRAGTLRWASRSATASVSWTSSALAWRSNLATPSAA